MKDKFWWFKFVIFNVGQIKMLWICPFSKQYKFRCSKFVPLASTTNLEGLKLSFLKKYKFRSSKFVLFYMQDNFPEELEHMSQLEEKYREIES